MVGSAVFAAGGAISLGVTLVVTPYVVRFATSKGLFDAPDGVRRIHSVAVPRLGGVAVVIALVTALALVHFAIGEPIANVRLVYSVGGACALLFALGIVDDITEVVPAVKLVVQLVASAIVILGGLKLDGVGFSAHSSMALSWFAVPLLVLWLVGATNAYNFIDGLNGLAGGIGLVASITITSVALTLGHTTVALAAVALGAGLLGFLRFNFPDARVFLGDCGSMPIGFLLAVLAVQCAMLPNGTVLFVIPIVALFIPLVDALLALMRRWLRGDLGAADARHIHHRLIALGVSQRRATIVLWSVGSSIALLGVVTELTPPVVAVGLTVAGSMALLALVVYGTRLLAYHEFKVAGEVLRTGPGHMRRVISDQIQAHDVSILVRYAETIADVSRILDANASRFGFESMEVRALNATTPHLSPIHQKLAGAWRLEYPLFVTDQGRSGGATHSFSIWCRINDDARPFGAERVARVLAPVLEYRIAEIHQCVLPAARAVNEDLKLSLGSVRRSRWRTR